MGKNPADKEPVAFDGTNPRFIKGYFNLLHHPYEKSGVDFWWLDWQQGNKSKTPGLDPLWWLNHLHFYDSGRNENARPVIFSRWGGLGNHRYPIGFSGDTLVSWDSLAFQPYFTSTAPTDATEEIVRNYGDKRVHLWTAPRRGGKKEEPAGTQPGIGCWATRLMP